MFFKMFLFINTRLKTVLQNPSEWSQPLPFREHEEPKDESWAIPRDVGPCVAGLPE